VEFCGDVFIDFDASGCGTALRVVGSHPKLEACITANVNATRWGCIAKTGLPRAHARAVADCLSRDE